MVGNLSSCWGLSYLFRAKFYCGDKVLEFNFQLSVVIKNGLLTVINNPFHLAFTIYPYNFHRLTRMTIVRAVIAAIRFRINSFCRLYCWTTS
jgi:hypothetical protein